MDAELILLDNQSTDGCCRGLPSEVLIIRTDRLESPAGLLRLGCSLAIGESVVWLPEISSMPACRFLELVSIAIDEAISAAVSDRGPAERASFPCDPSGAARCAQLDRRSRLKQWSRTPLVGRAIVDAAARWLPMFIPLETTADRDRRPLEEARRRQTAAALVSVSGTEAAPFFATVGDHHGAQRRRRSPPHRRVRSFEYGDEPRSDRRRRRIDRRILLRTRSARRSRHPPPRAHRRGVLSPRGKLCRGWGCLRLSRRPPTGRTGLPGPLRRAAAEFEAIICAPCRPLARKYPVSYGASFTVCKEFGYFSGRYRTNRPRDEVTRISGLRAPGYLIPRSVYQKVRWIAGLRGWGATDYGVALKAFFADVDILHVNAGATEHLFRTAIPYETTWDGVWRNHALLARVCFDDRTWQRYWLPAVFRAKLSEETIEEMNSPAVLAEHEEFLAIKARPDREFWRGLAAHARAGGSLSGEIGRRAAEDDGREQPSIGQGRDPGGVGWLLFVAGRRARAATRR